MYLSSAEFSNVPSGTDSDKPEHAVFAYTMVSFLLVSAFLVRFTNFSHLH